VALSSTIYHLQIALSDIDRGVYETLDMRVARHPSESLRYLLTRLLAYCLLYEEGITFTRGLGASEEPAIWVRDLQGQLRVWVDIGDPAGERLHRASKASPRVVIVTHHDVDFLRRDGRQKTIHRAGELEVVTIPAALLAALEPSLDRTTHWQLTRTENQLYIEVGGKTLEGTITEARLGEG
jgi:uncharacterized protein YaeQ